MSRFRNNIISLAVLMPLFAPMCLSDTVTDPEMLSGQTIMAEVYARHRPYPYVYEEQSMILVDKYGHRDTRKLRRYSRIGKNGSVRFLLLFDSPAEVAGVALLATRDQQDEIKKFIYLPALGEDLVESEGQASDARFLGSDFSVEDLVGEVLNDYQYIYQEKIRLDDVDYFIVDVYRPDDHPDRTVAIRRHYIQQENYFISRTEHYDRQGRLLKVKTSHDIKPVEGDMWRAGMILMDNRKELHQTLIKINRRVFSEDYVPEYMFHAEWLFENLPSMKQENTPASETGEVGIVSTPLP